MNRAEHFCRALREFHDYFSTWDIRIPEDDIEARRSGFIAKRGWAIWYCFGDDENGAFIDIYASHRHPGDSHSRYYESGESVNLPELWSGPRGYLPDKPGDREKAYEEFAVRQREVQEMLDAKGFGIRSDAPLSVRVNRALVTGNPDKDEGGK